MSTNTPFASAAPNWYADPQNPAQERYWDGATWTYNVRPASAPAYAAWGQQQKAFVGNGFSITAIVLGIIAVLILPIIIGPIGIVFGAVAKSRGEALANNALIVACVGTVAGMLLGALVVMSMG